MDKPGKRRIKLEGIELNGGLWSVSLTLPGLTGTDDDDDKVALTDF